MIASGSMPSDAGTSLGRWQYSVASLVCLTATVGLCLAYARLFGEAAVFAMVATPLIALPLGCLAGAVFGRIGLAIYWALVGATLATTCAVAAPIDGGQLYFWPILGSLVGGLVGSRIPPHKPATSWLAQTIDTDWIVVELLVAVVVVTSLCFFEPSHELTVDMATAAAAAIGLAGLIRTIEWLHRRRKAHTLSRHVWAAGLILATMAGNLAARTLG